MEGNPDTGPVDDVKGSRRRTKSISDIFSQFFSYQGRKFSLDSYADENIGETELPTDEQVNGKGFKRLSELYKDNQPARKERSRSIWKTMKKMRPSLSFGSRHNAQDPETELRRAKGRAKLADFLKMKGITTPVKELLEKRKQRAEEKKAIRKRRGLSIAKALKEAGASDTVSAGADQNSILADSPPKSFSFENSPVQIPLADTNTLPQDNPNANQTPKPDNTIPPPQNIRKKKKRKTRRASHQPKQDSPSDPDIERTEPSVKPFKTKKKTKKRSKTLKSEKQSQTPAPVNYQANTPQPSVIKTLPQENAMLRPLPTPSSHSDSAPPPIPPKSAKPSKRKTQKQFNSVPVSASAPKKVINNVAQKKMSGKLGGVMRSDSLRNLSKGNGVSSMLSKFQNNSGNVSNNGGLKSKGGKKTKTLKPQNMNFAHKFQQEYQASTARQSLVALQQSGKMKNELKDFKNMLKNKLEKGEDPEPEKSKPEHNQSIGKVQVDLKISSGPSYDKYKKMQKMRMPEGAIRNAMSRDGLSDTDIDAFFAQAQASANMKTLTREKKEKYKSKLLATLREIQGEMAEDGVDLDESKLNMDDLFDV